VRASKSIQLTFNMIRYLVSLVSLNMRASTGCANTEDY